MIAKKHIYGRRPLPPNTFIGGVGGSLSTKNLLATKLGIAPTRIKSFRIVNDEVQAHITGTYQIPSSCFGALNIEDANQSITHYYDIEGLVNYLGRYCFKYCSNFYSFEFHSLTRIENNAFAYTKIINADLSHLPTNVIGENNWFQGCQYLESADLGNYAGNWIGTFVTTPKLNSFSGKPTYLTGTFRNSGTLGGVFDSPYVLELRGFAFANKCLVQTVVLPNCTKFSNEEFYRGSSTTEHNNLKTVIAPKVVSIGVNGGTGGVFIRNSALELLDIRACKYFYGTPSFTNAFTSGGIIKVHEFMNTSNSGNTDAQLVSLKTTRNVVVEFYDDNGNYISTL